MSLLTRVFSKYRGVFVVLFALPLSFISSIIQKIRNWFFRNFLTSNKLHDKEVEKVRSLVKEAYKSGKLMCTSRASWKTISLRKSTYKEHCIQIPIRLRNILSLDEEKQILTVEPLVTMGEISHYLLPKGYSLPVLPEMDDLTVGGLCMGIGIESSSHRYGFLFETVKAYEIITADGSLIRATRDEHPELFHSLPMSHGTLGFLVSVELSIVKMPAYMRLEYKPYKSMETFCKEFEEYSRSVDPPSFLEGLVFSVNTAVAMLGEAVEKPENGAKVNRINRWYKPWFHKHVEGMLESGNTVEYIPIRQYYHRHTPSVFFQLNYIVPFAHHRWYRWFFSWMGAPRISLMKLFSTKELRRRSYQNWVAQDIIIPIEKMKDALDLIDNYYNIYPLWICPAKLKHTGYKRFIRKRTELDEMFVDIGIYGISPNVDEGKWKGPETGRKLEAYVRKNFGFQLLYADIYMRRDEFEEMFDHELYRQLRKKYHADQALPEVYDKVIPEKWLVDS